MQKLWYGYKIETFNKMLVIKKVIVLLMHNCVLIFNFLKLNGALNTRCFRITRLNRPKRSPGA